MTLPQSELERLEGLLERATKGPWREGRTATTHHVSAGMRRIAIMPIKRDTPSSANAELTVAAVNALPTLIADNRALSAEVERMREAIEQALDDMGEEGLCVCGVVKQMLIAAISRNTGDGA